MKLNKLIALLLALVMVFGLVACGAKEEAAAPAAPEAAPEKAPAEENAPAAEEEQDEVMAEESEDAEAEIIEEELTEEAIADEEAELVFNVGDRIIAYTTGAMTMSLPPQMNALAIVFDLEDAEVSEGEIEESEEAEVLGETDSEESDETVG